MNAISRTTDSTSNTTLSLVGCCNARRTTAIEYKRIEFELVQSQQHDCDGPDEKLSRHTRRFLTQGCTLPR